MGWKAQDGGNRRFPRAIDDAAEIDDFYAARLPVSENRRYAVCGVGASPSRRTVINPMVIKPTGAGFSPDAGVAPLRPAVAPNMTIPLQVQRDPDQAAVIDDPVVYGVAITLAKPGEVGILKKSVPASLRLFALDLSAETAAPNH